MTGRFAKGWCPGALRPMESGDGLIVRLKLTGGIVPLELAANVADWSARWGNGQIDLTSRANLQIRGVTAAGIEPLQQTMAAAGLLDVTPEGEAVRNVIASPLAGIDPDARLDIRPVVTSLEARLASSKRLHGLPAKFCWLVDDGGRFSLGDVRADIRFEAKDIEGETSFAIYDDGEDKRRTGSCKIGNVAEAAGLLGSVFLSLSEQFGLQGHRMRDLRTTKERRRAERGNIFDPRRAPLAGGLQAVLGAQQLAEPGVFLPDGQPARLHAFLGVGLPFGRIAADDLKLMMVEASLYGATELRLTPWRAIFIPLPTRDGAQYLADALPSDSFILDPADPRLRVVACVGVPGCPRATTDVRTDATHLATLVRPGDLLHVSGCPKGCAHPRVATVTLVGDGGAYNLVCGGPPGDEAVRTGLDIEGAEKELRRIMNEGHAA